MRLTRPKLIGLVNSRYLSPESQPYYCELFYKWDIIRLITVVDLKININFKANLINYENYVYKNEVNKIIAE
jgi:hypothetical protein